jgi:transposase
MMGRQVAQRERYELINLDEFVPQDHLLRAVDRYLDLTEFRAHLASSYSQMGRPSIDPELMIRMLIIGYCYGIRSERRLCEEVHLNLAYRWFCHLSLHDKVPDHSTFSKNRHGRFRDSDAFRQLFESVLRRCMAEGLVEGEGFATDASIVKADAQRQRAIPGSRTFNWGDPDQASRPIREYLAALAGAEAPESPPKSISLTHPSATWTAVGGPAIFAYSTNYLVDLKAGIIMDVEGSSANKTAEVNATMRMIKRVEQTFAMKPHRLVGDTSYGSAAMLGWLIEQKQITPHVPVFDKSERSDGTFGRSSFTFDKDQNRYACPAGKFLQPARRRDKKNPYRYRASVRDCRECTFKPVCRPPLAVFVFFIYARSQRHFCTNVKI